VSPCIQSIYILSFFPSASSRTKIEKRNEVRAHPTIDPHLPSSLSFPFSLPTTTTNQCSQPTEETIPPDSPQNLAKHPTMLLPLRLPSSIRSFHTPKLNNLLSSSPPSPSLPPTSFLSSLSSSSQADLVFVSLASDPRQPTQPQAILSLALPPI